MSSVESIELHVYYRLAILGRARIDRWFTAWRNGRVHSRDAGIYNGARPCADSDTSATSRPHQNVLQQQLCETSQNLQP